MSDDIDINVAEQQDDVIDYKAKYEEAQKSIEALSNKKEELLKETKAAKEEKRRQAEEAEKSKLAQLEAAQKNGEFEKLWKAAEQEKESYKNELTNYQKELRNSSIDVKAEKIALQLTNKDPDKAELLKVFVAESISKLADQKGHIDEDVLIGIKKQFETDAKFQPLRGSNLSVGGNAEGNARRAGNDMKQLSLDEFSKLNPKQKLDFSLAVKAGKAKLI